MVMALYAIAELISAGSGPGPKCYQGLLELAPEEALVLGTNGAWTACPVAGGRLATVRIKPANACRWTVR